MVNLENQVLDIGRRIKGNESFLRKQKQSIKDLRFKKLKYQSLYREALLKALFSPQHKEDTNLLYILKEVKENQFSLDHPTQKESAIAVGFYKHLLEGSYLDGVMGQKEETQKKMLKLRLR